MLVGHTKKALDEALPRRWKCHSAGRPIVVLTDGSYEKGRALWGAVVLDREDNLKAVHHGTVPEQLLMQWRSLGIEQIICPGRDLRSSLGPALLRPSAPPTEGDLLHRQRSFSVDAD